MEAAVDALASDPEVSIAEIARRAGVVRATVYMHFPSRESLIEAVTERAIAEATAAIEAAEPERGDATEALRRVLATAWHTLGRYHGLVAINTQLPHADLRSKHHAVLASLEPLIKRGQRNGTFRTDVPATWHLSMVLALIHAASAELRSGRVREESAESALQATILGAMGVSRN
jgi:TetR/AcrR family transcriptional regulator, mexCD-oprJ operon repressor